MSLAVGRVPATEEQHREDQRRPCGPDDERQQSYSTDSGHQRRHTARDNTYKGHRAQPREKLSLRATGATDPRAELRGKQAEDAAGDRQDDREGEPIAAQPAP